MACRMIPITFSIPSRLVELIKSFEAQIPGTEFRLVGGCIRDLILNRVPKDWDIITNASPEQIILKLGLENVGKGFPVFLHQTEEFGQIEVACCRTERKVGIGHNAFEVKVCTSFEEDAMRRDLVINALSWHHSISDMVFSYYIETNESHPYNVSVEDQFKKRILTHVSPAFAEDPLRVFRVARFAAQLSNKAAEWTVDFRTCILMESLEEEVTTLPPDRVRGEMESAFFKSTPECGNIFFKVLKDVGADHYWFAECNPGTPMLIWKDSEFKKEMLYMGLAYSIATGCRNRTELQTEVKDFCKRLQCGLDSEMIAFGSISLVMTEILMANHLPNADTIFGLCRSLLRGKIPLECYFDGMREINRKSSHSIAAQGCLEMLFLLCLALKEMRFTSEDKPTEIRANQLACVREFVELFLGKGTEGYEV